jgi:diguanylate cyclase (GGDEF)-like protein/PAS domain S-box-containing protein
MGAFRRLRLRTVLTTFAVTLVVVGEFGLLSLVYHRPDAVHHERLTQSTLRGVLRTADDPTPALDTTVAQSIQKLSDEGLSNGDLAALRRAGANLAANPGSVAAWGQVENANGALGTVLSHRERRINDEAEILYVILLILASVGWFGWFRTVVRRQRSLERTLTEQTSQAQAEATLAALVRNASDVIAVVEEDCTITYVSPSASKVIGVDPETLLNTRFTGLLHPDDVDHLLQVIAITPPGGEQPLNVRVRRPGRSQIHAEGEIRNLVDDPSVAGYIVTVRDVSERRLLEEQLTHQALHDSLTGLANRRLLADRLEHSLERRGDRMEPQVVLFIDLDDFKTVNDSLGHSVGDEVLAKIGASIRGLLRSGDTAARVGGDEFAVLMEGATIADAEIAAQRLIDAISTPMELAGVTVQITASIGITHAIPGEVTAGDALRNADLAMYWAKDSGKAKAAVYESRLHAAALERMQLRADLQRALADDEFLLHYQPEVDLATGEIVGVEALVRWQHPTRGLIPPLSFIPMAEESGLIASIDAWVIKTACRTAGELQEGDRPLTMSVNVSAAYFDHPDLITTVAAGMRDNGIGPGQLVLEITESVLLRDIDAVIPRLKTLREMGVRIAIDDFGTGYSSLAYLSHLEVDILKIDKSFVDRITLDRQDAAVTKAIISIGQDLDLETVAEGVEDVGQADWLRTMGCTIGQGFVWSRPIDREALRQVLADGVVPVPAPREAMALQNGS